MIELNADSENDVSQVDIYKAYKRDLNLQSWFNDFCCARFKKNCCQFKEKFENVFSLIDTYSPKQQYELFCNSDGVANVYFKNYDSCLYNEARDAIDFSRKQIIHFLEHTSLNVNIFGNEKDPFGQFHFKYKNALASKINASVFESASLASLKSIPSIMFLGLGLGYPLAEFLERIECKNIIIVEPDIDLFYASLFVFDWENFLSFAETNNLRLRFVIGDKTEYISLYLKHFFAHHGVSLSSSLVCFKHYNSKSMSSIEQSVRNVYPFLFSPGFFDDAVFGMSHTITNLVNKKRFVVKSLENTDYAELPVFIIGSGPSLDNSIPFLRANQDKAIIIACGTAIDSLYHAGIQPDFYANTERTPEVCETLMAIPDPEFLDSVFLLTINICNPKTVACFKNTAIFSKANEKQIEQLSLFFSDLKDIIRLDGANPLVGNMGISGALHLGFKKLFLFGYDNGKKIGTDSIHSKYVSFFKDNKFIEERDSYKMTTVAEGNFGGKCETNNLYRESAYRCSLVLDDFMAKDSSVQCINCSDGIIIKNTVAKRERDLCDYFDKKEAINKNDIKKYVSENITKSFNLSSIDINRLFSVSDFKQLVSEIIVILDSKCETRIDFIDKIELVSEKLADLQLVGKNRFYPNAINGSLQYMFIAVIFALYSKADESNCIGEVKFLLSIIKEFLIEASSVIEKIDDYILGDHRKYYSDGKVGKDMPHCKAPLFPEELILTKKKNGLHQKFIKRNQ